MIKYFLFYLLFFIGISVYAEVQYKQIEYRDGETVLEGYLAYNDVVKGKRPGVIVVHNWLGFGPIANKRADMLAELGYIALAVDIYGKGIRPKDNSEAGHQAMLYKGNRKLMRQRVLAGVNELKKHSLADPTKLAAIGYCFGGTVVLELARSGEDLRGVVSFHGGLEADENLKAKQGIKGKILALHGADDPFATPEIVKGFMEEMTIARADWQFVTYGGTVHSFTNPSAGNDPSRGVAYNSLADSRSWEAMKQFFDEIFR